VCDDPAERYVQWLCYFTPEMKDALYTTDFLHQTAGSDSVRLLADIFNHAPAESLLEKSLYADVMLYLPGDLLVKVDIASMAHSLEARSPFLDHKVMEFAASLPPHLKLRGTQTKYLLKKSFAGMLPPDILYRKKMGFGVPLHRWFQRELKQAVYDVLLDSRTTRRGCFRKDYVQALLDEHVQRKADHSYRIWALFYFELWQRMHIDKSDVLGI
jgi:asparagine synthase (glutamine-hydrolysing)